MTNSSRSMRALLAALALVSAGSVAHAGLPLRNEEGRPLRVMDKYRDPEGFVPADVRNTWGRFVDSIEKARDKIAVSALKPAEAGKGSPDLGDGFLDGFAKERGLKKKLHVLSGYRIGLDRAFRWISSLPEPSQQALRTRFGALAREAAAAEHILVQQIGTDLAKGGQGLSVTVEFVQRTGFTEETASAAFQGLLKGLKGRLMSLANAGEIDEAGRRQQARQLQLLERLIRGE